MAAAKRVGIGVIGAGFLARTRMRCYAQVGGYHADVVAVAASSDASARSFADAHGIAQAFGDYHDLLALPEIDVVDVCVPNRLHREITEAAARAGKHVICTKPLTAYVGQDLDAGGKPAQTPRECDAADGARRRRSDGQRVPSGGRAVDVRRELGLRPVDQPRGRVAGQSRAARSWKCAAANATRDRTRPTRGSGGTRAAAR